MSQNIAPGMESQLEGPSRLELFWEKNKKVVYFGLFAAAVAIAIHYAWKYKLARDRSEAWSELAVSSDLDMGYTQPASSWSFIERNLSGDPRTASTWLNFYFGDAIGALVGQFREQLKGSDDAKLAAIGSGTDSRAPLAIWILGCKALESSDFDAATKHFEDLKTRFSGHFLCRESSYPVQWRDKVPEPKKSGDDAKAEKKDEAPKLLPAQSGSAVDRKLTQIAEEKSFRATHPEFYVAPEPDSKETISIEIENAGTIKFKLFSSRSPKHAARLLELAQQDGGWWVGQRVHQIERAPGTGSFNNVHPSHFVFGWPTTKEDDRTKWKQEVLLDTAKIDWEVTGVSLFPGMVSVESAGEGKSQVERLVFNAGDEARVADGSRVVIGKVVDGMEIVQRIVDSEFADDAGAQNGRGRPQENFRIKSVKVD